MAFFFLFVLGLAIGSFLNVLIDRLPNERTILGRSRCDYCRKKLAVKDLIPLFSYLFLGGKCRYCHKKLSFQYPLVELLTGLLFVVSWIYLPFGNEILKIFYLGLICGLIVVFFADWKNHVIPDQINIILLILSIIILFLQIATNWFLWFSHLRDGIVVMLPILLIYLVTKGRGMGFGDVKLTFIIGFLLEMIAGFYALYFAFISGAIFGLILVFLRKRKMKDVIAFGPFLVLGFAIMIFFKQPILDFFVRFYF